MKAFGLSHRDTVNVRLTPIHCLWNKNHGLRQLWMILFTCIRNIRSFTISSVDAWAWLDTCSTQFILWQVLSFVWKYKCDNVAIVGSSTHCNYLCVNGGTQTMSKQKWRNCGRLTHQRTERTRQSIIIGSTEFHFIYSISARNNNNSGQSQRV